ncbi:DUF928 domain-containing protein [Anabaena sp. FACHB-709]|uniref:DUF928 domain-containing protein n=2 Tax=Nostocaceae TaxID=1162 RepID=A0A1Z4KIV5_ANAVA|nr:MULTISPECIES: DUF928 domain-containing protein [Nostocaceae]BAY68803.1 hypothetical protein NIES23_15920 [Trichormus variabilis NIES-23]HBW33553.1 DUF928 domain-containing protein [Nostoc sp. UBA8866]MBD2170381.1 DUF928 domain-containing protein [Anabaena cylindrica FACHB-318]MBD2262142.1 DUF928 domain-containing protein [Anabaena sp. FACHB-709]MBD2271714.1 DUF928 domain-containing protein [Nostoc sp. PCC 7120 = FACHB-418]
MSTLKPIQLLLALTIGYTSLLSANSWVLATTPVNPHNNNNISTAHKKTTFTQPPLPSSERRPGGRVRGGAKRGTCPSVEPQLTALVPFTQDAPTVTNVWGLTTKAHPTFLFYVPYAKDSAYPTEFVLQDQDTNIIYQKAIALPDKPGIISVSLPADAVGLAVDKQYRWFFTVECDQQKPAPPIYVEGVVQRVQLKPETTKQLETASPLQQVAIYAENGIWFEAANTLFQMLQKNPQDPAMQERWRKLLTSISLDDVVAKPMISRKLQ